MFMTLKEAAAQAGVHENTARFYRDKFEEFFPTTGEGRNRKYSPVTVDILKKIKMCYDSKMDADQVRERLAEEYGHPVFTTEMAVRTPQEEFTAVVVEQMQITIQQYVDVALDRQAALYAEKVEEFKKEIQELKEYITQSEHNRDTRDFELMRRIREIQQVQQEQVSKKPWWKFWG